MGKDEGRSILGHLGGGGAGETLQNRISHVYVLYITHITLVHTDTNETAAHSLSPAVPVRRFLTSDDAHSASIHNAPCLRRVSRTRRKTGGGAHPSS